MTILLRVSLLLLSLVYLSEALNFFYQSKRPINSDVILEEEPLRNQTFDQKFDHFNESSSNHSWKQYFWQNDKYYKKENEIQFLWIGGEGPENPYHIQNEEYPIVEWAKLLGAQLWNLEHRFYGVSQPFEDLPRENLKYLSGRQALEDLANFIRSKNEEKKFKNPKWIVFGGSYPGNLALWLRKRYPDLIVGAVGSSAPLKLVVENYEYLQKTQFVYESINPSCSQGIREGFKQIDDMMDNLEGRVKLDKLLNLNSSLMLAEELSEASFQYLYFNLMIAFSTQNSNIEEINELAKFFNDKNVTDPVKRLLNAREWKVGNNTMLIFDLSTNYQKFIERLSNVSHHEDNMFGAITRAWTWQTCNEFGLFQSTGFYGIFGPHVPVSFFYKICMDAFGKEYDVDFIQEKVRQANEYYGKVEDYNATNVLITHHQLDPWSALGLYTSKNPSMVIVQVNGTSHMEDLKRLATDTESTNLKEAQKMIFENLQKWISGIWISDSNSVEVKENKKELVEFDSKICWNCKLPRMKLSNNNMFLFNQNHPTIKPFDLSKKLGIKHKNTDDEENWFQQPYDHFNETEKRTFKQRFFFNDQFYKDGGPIFLYIEGEYITNEFNIKANVSFVYQLAKRYNAMLYSLEHRYYGFSQLMDPKSIDYQWHNSQQALADCISFIRKMNTEKGYKNPKWISFGGSYSGSLSPWLRQQYPDDVFAAYGSSGPFEAMVNFYGYRQRVEKDLDLKVDGCSKAIGRVVERTQQLFMSLEGRNVLNIYFDQSFEGPTVDPYRVMQFYDTMFHTLDAQNNIDGAIHKKCSLFVNSSIDDPLLAYNQTFMPFGKPSETLSFDGGEFDESIDWRAWMWQVCNEFVWHFSTDYGYSVFGNTIPINDHLLSCNRWFQSGYTRDQLESNVRKTNAFYGGAHGFKGSRVVVVYNSADPWTSIGLVPSEENIKNDVTKIVINGTTHCDDLLIPHAPNNPEEVQKAHEQVVEIFDRWLK